MDFLEVHFFDSGGEVKAFAVSTHFPKAELSDLTLTIEDLVSHIAFLSPSSDIHSLTHSLFSAVAASPRHAVCTGPRCLRPNLTYSSNVHLTHYPYRLLILLQLLLLLDDDIICCQSKCGITVLKLSPKFFP